MSDPDMDGPVTRRDLAATKKELRAELGAVHTELGAVHTRIGGIETRIGGIETRIGGIETRIGGLEQRFELFQGAVVERFIALESKVAQLAQLPQLLAAELARGVKAANEEMRDWMRAFEDRYRDLPPRVGRLEAKVFASRRRRR